MSLPLAVANGGINWLKPRSSPANAQMYVQINCSAMITVRGILTFKFYGERDRHKKREGKKKLRNNILRRRKTLLSF